MQKSSAVTEGIGGVVHLIPAEGGSRTVKLAQVQRSIGQWPAFAECAEFASAAWLKVSASARYLRCANRFRT